MYNDIDRLQIFKKKKGEASLSRKCSMKHYTMEIIFSKSKPLIIITFDDDTNLKVESVWKKKFKKINDKTYHIATVIAEKVFEKNEDILGKWNDATFENNEVKTFYGFTKIKGAEVHSLELSKRFVSDWIQEYAKLIKYTVHRNDGFPPITSECLYDASVYGDGTVGNITPEEVDCLRKVINPDGEIITRMKEKLKNTI